MPTKGKLPTSREMEGQVLAALREMGGPRRFDAIDERVKKNLEPWVLLSEFTKKVRDFYETSFSSKCARARTSLRKDGQLESLHNGEWQLKKQRKLDPTVIEELKKPRSSRLNLFAAGTIEILKDKGVKPDIIQEIWELCQAFQMESPSARPDSNEDKKVEAEAIAYILKKEPEKRWQQANTQKNPNNPGFDLYRTDKNCKTIAWCEVKGLSNDFDRVSLTHTEFETALEKGKRYWLYIVENAKSDSPTLLRINDPASKAKTFTYGTPWRDVAEN